MAEPRSADHLAYGQAFRQVRGERGISQERLAALAGLDRTYVSGIERGERNPSLTNLLRLSSTLDVRFREVATRADEVLVLAQPDDELAQLFADSMAIGRHPLSRALADATIRLKGLEDVRHPIGRDEARNILYDAGRLVIALVDVLQRYEQLSGDQTHTVSPLLRVFEQLTEHWQRYLPPLAGE